jgi:HAD superfamily hydrolase (TIGR01549 family)
VIKHLIFDLYGTLIDADPKKLAVNKAKLLEWGKTRWMCHNKKEGEYFSEYCKLNGGNPQELGESFKEMEESTAFFPDILDLLHQLTEEKYHLHILSNCGPSIQTFITEHKEIFDWFDTLNFSYELGAIKPEQEAFTTTLKRIGAQPNECVMIGDNRTSDIEPAKQLGLHTILFDGRHMQAKKLQTQLHKFFISEAQ